MIFILITQTFKTKQNKTNNIRICFNSVEEGTVYLVAQFQFSKNQQLWRGKVGWFGIIVPVLSLWWLNWFAENSLVAAIQWNRFSVKQKYCEKICFVILQSPQHICLLVQVEYQQGRILTPGAPWLCSARKLARQFETIRQRCESHSGF